MCTARIYRITSLTHVALCYAMLAVPPFHPACVTNCGKNTIQPKTSTHHAPRGRECQTSAAGPVRSKKSGSKRNVRQHHRIRPPRRVHTRLYERQRRCDIVRKARRPTRDDCLRWRQHKHMPTPAPASQLPAPFRAAALKSRIISRSASTWSESQRSPACAVIHWNEDGAMTRVARGPTPTARRPCQCPFVCSRLRRPCC